MIHLTFTLKFQATILLGTHLSKMPMSHHKMAFEFFEACHNIFKLSPLFIGPKLVKFYGSARPEDNRNMLRPEFIESLYYFYVITGKKKYQDIGWNIFQSFESYAKVSNGFASLGNVMDPQNVELIDLMDSYWFSKTLKYFYLLFSDNRSEIDLKKFLFNNAGHLIKIWNK